MSTKEDGQEVQEKEEEGAGMALHDTIDPSAYGFHITQRPASGVSGPLRKGFIISLVSFKHYMKIVTEH